MAGSDSFPAVTPTSRFQLYPSPVAAPGKCAICGAVNRPVVDFGMTIEFYGAVMFCIECMQSAARAVDMVSRVEVEAAEKSLAQSFATQLIERDLVAISHEHYIAITTNLSHLSNAVLSAGTYHADLVAESFAEANPTLFDDSERVEREDVEVESRDSGSSEQDDLTFGDEGPLSVSASSGDGNTSRFDL